MALDLPDSPGTSGAAHPAGKREPGHPGGATRDTKEGAASSWNLVGQRGLQSLWALQNEGQREAKIHLRSSSEGSAGNWEML